MMAGTSRGRLSEDEKRDAGKCGRWIWWWVSGRSGGGKEENMVLIARENKHVSMLPAHCLRGNYEL